MQFVVIALVANLRASTPLALFVIGGAALGLVFIGIHNAWDTVTYVIARGPGPDASGPR